MFRKTFIFTFLLLIFLACENVATEPATETEQPSTTPAQDQAAAQQLIQDIFDNVWAGTDTSYVSRYQTEDFVLLEHGEVWTNDTIRNYQLRKLANARPDQDRRLNSFDFFRTEQNGDEIWMAYHNRGHWVNTEGDTTFSMGWLESAVAKRYEDGWKLKMMHSTRLPGK